MVVVVAGVQQPDDDDASRAVQRDDLCDGEQGGHDRDERRRGAGLVVCHSQRPR